MKKGHRILLLFTCFVVLICLLAFPLFQDDWLRTSNLIVHALYWKSLRIKHYQFDLYDSNFGVPLDDRGQTVEIKDGEIVSITDIGNDAMASKESIFRTVSQYAPIEKLFQVVWNAIKYDPDEIVVAYNATYGFPENIYIDWVKEGWDEETSIEVVRFKVLP